jgi:hypothetical protein
MTTDKRDQQSEPEFEQDLEVVRSAWSGREKVEPPELLDQAVLNTARRELDARRKRRPLRWLGGFATATVVVLALTIIIQQDQQPTLEKTDGFMLDQAAPVARKKESKRDDRVEMAAPERAAGQIIPESGQRTEFRAQTSAAPQADPGSNAASITVAEEIVIAPAEPEKGANRILEAEAWIERLVLLRETQQDEKLVLELAAFREAYPDYPLPPELE